MRRSTWLGLALAGGLLSSACGSSPGGSSTSGTSTAPGSTGAGGRTSGSSSSGGASLGASSSSGGTHASSSGGTGGSSGASTAASGSSGAGASGSGGSTGWVLPSGRSFPDTWASIAILTDQLPSQLPAGQLQFAATHYVGTEKQLLPDTQALRAINPNFLVLHYHLAMWQSAVDFIDDGTSWGNDLATVTTHEDWFWHNASNGRVTAPDGKYLMNVSSPDFGSYWFTSLAQQVADGQYDGIMFDSASPSLLQAWCGGSGTNQDPRLAGTAARDTSFTELGNTTWIDAWQAWIGALNTSLAGQGIPLIPNDGAFITGWDDTDYSLTAGVFSEGFADPSFAESDWEAATNELLSLAAADKLLILQNYLGSPDDTTTRMYYLGNYLLVKGHHTYLDYFDSSGPLEWYPEWSLDLGAPTTPVTTQVSALLSDGVYRRDFTRGSVLVNPSSAPVAVSLGGSYQRVVPSGGGAVDTTGAMPGSLTLQPVTSITVQPTSAEVLLR